jgi:hypothetical protein
MQTNWSKYGKAGNLKQFTLMPYPLVGLLILPCRNSYIAISLGEDQKIQCGVVSRQLLFAFLECVKLYTAGTQTGPRINQKQQQVVILITYWPNTSAIFGLRLSVR